MTQIAQCPSYEKYLVSGNTFLDLLEGSVLSISDPEPWKQGFPGTISTGWRNDTWWLHRWSGGRRTSSRSWCVLSLPHPCGWTGAAPVENAKKDNVTKNWAPFSNLVCCLGASVGSILTEINLLSDWFAKFYAGTKSVGHKNYTVRNRFQLSLALACCKANCTIP